MFLCTQNYVGQPIPIGSTMEFQNGFLIHGNLPIKTALLIWPYKNPIKINKSRIVIGICDCRHFLSAHEQKKQQQRIMPKLWQHKKQSGSKRPFVNNENHKNNNNNRLRATKIVWHQQNLIRFIDNKARPGHISVSLLISHTLLWCVRVHSFFSCPFFISLSNRYMQPIRIHSHTQTIHSYTFIVYQRLQRRREKHKNHVPILLNSSPISQNIGVHVHWKFNENARERNNNKKAAEECSTLKLAKLCQWKKKHTHTPYRRDRVDKKVSNFLPVHRYGQQQKTKKKYV